ncbi:hypothetical protein [Haloplanus aerogenes]|uniref:Uncharacterized protein n=1 Tax=Haloplanus aerogenes TaxID=660522 RepID=A0A3G8QWT2_9EURY|nr:hypothetical protein [Haloplanus aerogenes]AZH26695.1 hypothetical protein DU502_15505 [Haloplanus aerogenes]
MFSNNPEDYQMPSIQQLRELYHFQQIDRIAEGLEGKVEVTGKKRSELLHEFPRRLLNGEWVDSNIAEVLEERHDTDLGDFFYEEVFNSKAPLIERIPESNYNGLWMNVEMLSTDTGVSSTHDFIRTAALAAAEHYSVGNETFTSHMKTLGGSHGLGIAMTGLTYNQSKQSNQKVYGIETDPNEPEQIWPLQKGYVNRDSRIPIEKPEAPGNITQWMGIGFDDGKIPEVFQNTEYSNINLQIEGVDQWVDFKRNSANHAGMKFVDSMVLAAYIEDEAYEDGQLPGLEDATVRVSPKGLDYNLA